MLPAPLLLGAGSLDKLSSWSEIRGPLQSALRWDAATARSNRERSDLGAIHHGSHSEGPTLRLRRIVVQLDKPTRDNDDTIAILANLPARHASAVAVAELYIRRWTLETLFFELTQMLHGELATMGHSRAALFGFAMALVSYNILSIVESVICAAFGHEKVKNDVSSYYIANEVRASQNGTNIVIEQQAWASFQAMTP